uniref:Uncharacterized protein n=1 Tax=Anguilla anguilla TaxID=7936 RepID=A0A0E9WVY8_ANGAN
MWYLLLGVQNTFIWWLKHTAVMNIFNWVLHSLEFFDYVTMEAASELLEAYLIT